MLTSKFSSRSQLLSLFLLGWLAFSLSACTGKKVGEESASASAPQSDEVQPDKASSGKVQSDITRPPTTIGAQREVVVETNPNETISFEEWQRQQLEQADTEEASTATPEQSE